jgi:hypothetical protein
MSSLVYIWINAIGWQINLFMVLSFIFFHPVVLYDDVHKQKYRLPCKTVFYYCYYI